MSIERIISDINDGAELFAAEIVASLDEKRTWQIVYAEIEAASKAISRRVSVLFDIYDQTTAGGKHSVLAYYDADANEATFEIPNDQVVVFPEDEVSVGGRFPTLLHAIEVVTLVARTVKLNRQQLDYYPNLNFRSRNDIKNLVVSGDRKKQHLAMLPLTVHPTRTNVIVLHQQARGNMVDAAKIVAAHYQLQIRDDSIVNDVLRHTMITQPSRQLGVGPEEKNKFWIGLLPHSISSLNFPLFNSARIRLPGLLTQVRPDTALGNLRTISSQNSLFHEFSF